MSNGKKGFLAFFPVVASNYKSIHFNSAVKVRIIFIPAKIFFDSEVPGFGDFVIPPAVYRSSPFFI
jgi:hypothetical protein